MKQGALADRAGTFVLDGIEMGVPSRPRRINCISMKIHGVNWTRSTKYGKGGRVGLVEKAFSESSVRSQTSPSDPTIRSGTPSSSQSPSLATGPILAYPSSSTTPSGAP